jgi:hypothetical protein
VITFTILHLSEEHYQYVELTLKLSDLEFLSFDLAHSAIV